MTQKEIIAIAHSEDAMSYLQEIAFIHSNLCCKTVYERKSAEREMKRLAKALIDCM